MTDTPDHPHAEIHLPRIPRLIWLIPAIAILLAAYLGWQALSERGPAITVAWRSADGLQAGQTKVKHKAVELGVVDKITLSDDLSHVVVRIRMRREAEPLLTEKAKLWVVRPRVTAGTMNRRRDLDKYLREEVEMAENERWWGRNEV